MADHTWPSEVSLAPIQVLSATRNSRERPEDEQSPAAQGVPGGGGFLVLTGRPERAAEGGPSGHFGLSPTRPVASGRGQRPARLAS